MVLNQFVLANVVDLDEIQFSSRLTGVHVVDNPLEVSDFHIRF